MSELRIKNKVYSSSSVHSYDLCLYHIHFTSFSSYNGYKLNSHLTCFRRGFTAQSVEHRTGTAEVMGSNPVGASEFFLGLICNYLSYFTTAKISFTSINTLVHNLTSRSVVLVEDSSWVSISQAWLF